MAVSDTLWEIETVIDDLITSPGANIDRQTAQARRSVYEQTLVDVAETAGMKAMYTLGNWIKREISVSERLPENHEVRQIGTEICRRITQPRMSQS